MNEKTAIIFGATGLVGSYVLKELLADNRYSRILVFTRKHLSSGNQKVTEILTGLENKESFENSLTGDEIYCCLGSTIRKAGSQNAFRKVDYDLPVMIGTAAKKHNIPTMMVISSIGADAESSNFYLRTKGEMEQTIRSLGIPHLHIFRPSMLLGPRNETRPAEAAGKTLMQLLSFLFAGPLKKYKAIHARTVARAMIEVANRNLSSDIFESPEIAELGKTKNA